MDPAAQERLRESAQAVQPFSLMLTHRARHALIGGWRRWLVAIKSLLAAQLEYNLGQQQLSANTAMQALHQCLRSSEGSRLGDGRSHRARNETGTPRGLLSVEKRAADALGRACAKTKERGGGGAGTGTTRPCARVLEEEE